MVGGGGVTGIAVAGFNGEAAGFKGRAFGEYLMGDFSGFVVEAFQVNVEAFQVGTVGTEATGTSVHVGDYGDGLAGVLDGLAEDG